MPVFKDRTGERYGRLVVVAPADRSLWPTQKRGWHWWCDCDCGSRTMIEGARLGGNTRSCGCARAELISEAKTKHGRSGSRSGAYGSWMAMKKRCSYPFDKCYHLYGGRGISVCERWVDSFKNFLEDMGERPEGMSLDRIDPGGNYEPSNCRWADSTTQRLNQRRQVESSPPSNLA